MSAKPSHLPSHLWIQSLLVGVSTALAFLLPETIQAVLLGWLSVVLIARLARISNNSYKFIYLSIVIAHAIGFYWLIDTISIFGNFPYWAACLIYILFTLTNSLYILVVPFLLRNLPTKLNSYFLTLPIAWTIAEFLSIRIFPWHYAHTQLAFLQFVQIADIAGALLVTFLLFWVGSLVESFFNFSGARDHGEKSSRKTLLNLSPPVLFPIIFLVLTLIYGQFQINYFSNSDSPSHKVVVVQGNIPIGDKHSSSLFRENIETYKSLGSAYEEKDNLIIWPETVVMAALPSNFSKPRPLPFLSPTPKWLVGSLTSDMKGNLFNSAIAVNEGSLAFDVYHKLILMPFGEYVPFSKSFPWLLELAHMEGEITPGEGVNVLTYPETTTTPELNIATLVCYEDIVSDLARNSVLKGADLLVNITNDAWFGETVAPYQHNLLAVFRSIENRRYLIRAANTGVSSIIDPTGKTASQLRAFSQGVLSSEITPRYELSIYTKYLGDLPWWILSILSLSYAIWTAFKEKSLARVRNEK